MSSSNLEIKLQGQKQIPTDSEEKVDSNEQATMNAENKVDHESTMVPFSHSGSIFDDFSESGMISYAHSGTIFHDFGNGQIISGRYCGGRLLHPSQYAMAIAKNSRYNFTNNK